MPFSVRAFFFTRFSTNPHHVNLPMKPLLLTLFSAFSLAAIAQVPTPPGGFTPLFNGRDLTGWRGGTTEDHRKLLALSEEERKTKLDAWTADMLLHWKVENGELLNDGQGKYCTTTAE